MADVRKIYAIGDSMLPTLPKRGYVDVLFFEKGESKHLKVGDIVVYYSKGFNREGKPSFWHRGRCLHRIIGMTPEYALIKGDNRNYIEKVKYKDILGVAVLNNEVLP